MEVHLDLPFLTIRWDEVNLCVWMEWKQFVRGDDFRMGLDRGLLLLKEKNASRWLADLRHLAVLETRDQEWSAREWFPRAIQAGLSRMAIVRPLQVIPNMSLERIMRSADLERVQVGYFEDISKAKAWLRISEP